MLYAKESILKKINVSFIIHFCHGKYNFSLDSFWKYFANWYSLMVQFHTT